MSAGVFDLRRAGPRSALVTLDPDQPYLRDHDVGTPLLGTVMSLEAMAEAALFLTGRSPLRLWQITAGEDCLVSAPRTLRCALEEAGGVVRASLLDGSAPVFACLMSFDPPVPPAPVLPEGEAGPEIGAEQVYRCFFHGSAFRVIAAARTAGEGLTARMNAALPALRTDRLCEEVLPVRAVEFCLQSSGLLDAAFRRYMSVPRSVGCIELYRPGRTGPALESLARFTDGGNDIVAFDPSGAPVLAVRDYRTKPMPYGAPGFDHLCEALRPGESL